MGYFIHGSAARSADGRIVHLGSSDDDDPVGMGVSSEAESSYQGEISNCETRLPDNGLLRKIQDKMPEFDGMIAKLMGIFPQLSPDQALYQLFKAEGQLPHEMLLQSAIDHFLQHGVPDTDLPVGHGRKEIGLDGVGTSYTVQEQDSIEIQAFESAPAGDIYEECSLYRLAEDFPLVRMSDLRQAFRIHNRNFTHTYRAVEQACRELRDSGKHKLKGKRDSGTNADILKRIWIPKNGFKLMRSPRPKKTKPLIRAITCPAFEKEWDCLQKESSRKLQTDLLTESKNSSEVESTNNACTPLVEDIECGCCCMEFPFEKMVQCADGHLFCFECLRKHVEESTFGNFQARSSLPCMDTSGCTESIPMSEVQRTLPVDVIERYEQRQAQADIEQAKLEGLVYCPFCNFPCEVDKDVRVLECPNSKCLKASCIECKELSHVPLRCEEVEKKSETAVRRRIEEVMAKAVIRVCNSCKAELVKTDGCNKVTCRCGTTMCYICRQTISKDYTHFCQHARDPERPCQYCKQCGLWEKELDDEVAVAAREKALKELAGEEPSLLSRNIGPPIKKIKESVDGRDPYGALRQHLHAQPNIFGQDIVEQNIVGHNMLERNIIERYLLYPANLMHGRHNAILALANPIRVQPHAIHAQGNIIPNEIGGQANRFPFITFPQVNPIPGHQPNAIYPQANRYPIVTIAHPNPIPVHQPNAIYAQANRVTIVTSAQPNPIPVPPNPIPVHQHNAIPAPPNAIAAQQPNAIPANPQFQTNFELARNFADRDLQEIMTHIRNARPANQAGIQFAGNGNQLNANRTEEVAKWDWQS